MANYNDIGADGARHSMRAVEPAGRFPAFTAGRGLPALRALFFVILTPFGWILRLSGKDFLHDKSPQDKQTFWQTARQDGSLDRMF